MPSKKGKNRKAAAMSQLANKGLPGSFPFASYVSVVGVHITLLAFTTFFLPRVSKPVLWASSPPSPFLEGLTRNPVFTLAWICAGTIPLQAWWAVRVRKWWVESSLKGMEPEKRLEQSERDKGILSVNWNLHFNLSTVDTERKMVYSY
jgi:GPI ethanolamine phosphate transferase 2/3 subunit F